MAKVSDDTRTIIYRFQRGAQDYLIRSVDEDKVHEPLVDICETKSCLRIEVELPGVKKESIEVSSMGDRVYIRARKEEDMMVEAGNVKREFLCLEREFGEFYREIELQVAVDTAGGRAHLADGLLIIEFPKLSDRRCQRRVLNVE